MDDLNRKVCEKLGWKDTVTGSLTGRVGGTNPAGDLNRIAPDYTTDLNALFRDVVPKMGDVIIGTVEDRWFCNVYGVNVRNQSTTLAQGEADTPAEAICRAFLQMEDE